MWTDDAHAEGRDRGHLGRLLDRLARGCSDCERERRAAALFATGLALAVWARVCLGRNWGMPMSRRAEPQLVTSGPYAVVRHPIYTGILLALLGSSIAINVIGIVLVLVLGANFYYSALVEERNMAASFPSEYPEYRARTKMMLPFLL